MILEKYKIGIDFGDSQWKQKDFSHPEKGNPGMGGTQYNSLLLAWTLAEYNRNLAVYLIHSEGTNKYPQNVTDLIVSEESKETIAKLELDIFITNNDGPADWLYEVLKSNNVKIITIVENFMRKEWMEKIMSREMIKRVVFVGNEQYDWCIDTKLIQKSTVIGNLTVCNHERYRESKGHNHAVTYMGALLPQKGFHVLAKQWKYVVSKVPDAQLYVIGSGKLYNADSSLGSYGLSTEEYESVFIPYLLDDDGEMLDSVHFLGTMGQEKEDIFLKTSVGVPNPTAETETFCCCATEMQSYGIPLVTIAKNSFFDVTKDTYSAFLYHSEKDFGEKIVRLLLNEELNEQMGQNAKEFAKKFSPEELVNTWSATIEEVIHDCSSKYIRNYKHLFYNLKILRVVNRFLRIHLHLNILPCAIEGYTSGLKKGRKY